MIKKIAKFTLILFICIDVFIIYKVIYTYVNIENQKKESTWVKISSYYHRKNKGFNKYLDLAIGSKSDLDIEETIHSHKNRKYDFLLEKQYHSFRSFPNIRDRDSISYYILDDTFFDYDFTFREKPRVVGISTIREVRSNFQLFLDIAHYYVHSALFYLPYVIIFLFMFVDQDSPEFANLAIYALIRSIFYFFFT